MSPESGVFCTRHLTFCVRHARTRDRFPATVHQRRTNRFVTVTRATARLNKRIAAQAAEGALRTWHLPFCVRHAPASDRFSAAVQPTRADRVVTSTRATARLRKHVAAQAEAQVAVTQSPARVSRINCVIYPLNRKARDHVHR